jgi:hypothetical protein
MQKYLFILFLFTILYNFSTVLCFFRLSNYCFLLSYIVFLCRFIVVYVLLTFFFQC